MRLRILELPMETVGEVTKTPFVFVVDQVEQEEAAAWGGDLVNSRQRLDTSGLAEQAGARGVLIFAGDVDLG